MPSASPLRLTALGLALAGTVLLAGLTPWPVSHPAWRDAVRSQIAKAVGTDKVELDAINLTLLPSPQLDVTRLFVDVGGANLSGTAASARLSIAPLSLLTGPVQATEVVLNGADLLVRLPRALSPEPRALTAQVAQLSRVLNGVGAETGIRRVILRNSTLMLTSVHGTSQSLSSIDLDAGVAKDRAPLTLAMSGNWQGAPVRIAFSGASSASLDGAVMEPVSLSLSWADGKAEFRGQGHFAADAALKGAVQASFSGALPFATGPSALVNASRMRTTMSATVDGTMRGATLTDLTIRNNDDRFVGIGAARLDNSRWHVSATLAKEQADLGWLVSPIMNLRDANGGWNSERIVIDDLLGFNLDLRLSADKLKVHHSLLERAALTLLSRPTRLEATLGDARLNGGTVRARALASPTPDGLDLKVSASLDGADIATTFSEIGIDRRLRGIGSGSLSFDASGRTAAELVASSNGRFQLLVRDGDLIGIDLNRLADRKPSRPGTALTEAMTGKTPFESLVLSSKIVQGAAGPIDGRMQAGRIVGALQGTVDLSQGQHRLNGAIVQVGGDTFQIEPVPVLEFSVNGPLTAPRFEPNLQTLLNRS